MKTRILLLLVAIALVALGIWSTGQRGSGRRLPRKAQAEVPIQDGKTIDFSTGKPVVRDDSKEKATIAAGVAQMDAAAGNLTFAPKSAPPPPPTSK